MPSTPTPPTNAVYFGGWRVDHLVGYDHDAIRISFVPIIRACGAYTGMHPTFLFVPADLRMYAVFQSLGVDASRLTFSSATALCVTLHEHLDGVCGWAIFVPGIEDGLTPITPQQAARAIVEAEYMESSSRFGLLRSLLGTPPIDTVKVAT